MDTDRIAQTPAPFTLHREGTQEPVSEHEDFASAWRAGQQARNEDPGASFALYSGGTLKATFSSLNTADDLDADLTATLAALA